MQPFDVRECNGYGERAAGSSDGGQQQSGVRGRDIEPDRVHDIGGDLQLDGSERLHLERAEPFNPGRHDGSQRPLQRDRDCWRLHFASGQQDGDCERSADCDCKQQRACMRGFYFITDGWP